MNLSNTQKKFLLFPLPILTLVGAGFFHFSSQYINSPASYGLFPLIPTLASLVSIFSLWLILRYLEVSQKLEEARKNWPARQNVRELEKKLELLSALREMSLAINEQTDFKTILLTVLHLMSVVLTPKRILIFLREQDSLKAVVLRQGQETLFFQDIPPRHQEESWARESYQKKRNLIYHLGESVVSTHILSAEKETLGVMVIELERDQEPMTGLEVLSKHIALAIRKPTLYDRAVLDSLTTLYSKGHFVQEIQKLFCMSRRLNKPFSLILMDIDHFKSVNDTYGHLTGDGVLYNVSQAIKGSIREYDSAYRYGGEELVVLLPDTGSAHGWRIAERIRKKIQSLSMTGEKGETFHVTTSAGVSSFSSEITSVEDMISIADKFLYQAKHQGRNRVMPPLCGDLEKDVPAA